MGDVGADEIRQFLQHLAERYTEPVNLYLIGGGALCLLGNSRRTLDIDYVGDDLHLTPFQHIIEQVAREMKLEVEPVPLATFIPLPDGAEERSLLLGSFGSISVRIFDPYSIALSKLDRGTKTDLQDIVFLVRQKLIDFERLEQVVQNALPHANAFDLSVNELREHLATTYQMLGLHS